MAKKDIVDRIARTGIPGVSGLGKVVNESAWGESKALERYGRDYGGAPKTFPNPPDQSYPQFKVDQRGPDWADDHPNNWVRGAGGRGEAKPGYVPGGGSVSGRGKK